MDRISREGRLLRICSFLYSLETVPLEHVGNPMYVSHSNDTNNMLFPSELEPLVIIYQNNKSANL